MATLEFNATPQVTATITADGTKNAVNISAATSASFTTTSSGIRTPIRRFLANNLGYPIQVTATCDINVAYGSVDLDTANTKASGYIRINQPITVDFNQTAFTPQLGVNYRIELKENFVRDVNDNQTAIPARTIQFDGIPIIVTNAVTTIAAIIGMIKQYNAAASFTSSIAALIGMIKQYNAAASFTSSIDIETVIIPPISMPFTTMPISTNATSESTRILQFDSQATVSSNSTSVATKYKGPSDMFPTVTATVDAVPAGIVEEAKSWYSGDYLYVKDLGLVFDSEFRFASGGTGSIRLFDSTQTQLNSWNLSSPSLEWDTTQTPDVLMIRDIDVYADTINEQYFITIDSDTLEYNSSLGYRNYPGLELSGAKSFTQKRAVNNDVVGLTNFMNTTPTVGIARGFVSIDPTQIGIYIKDLTSGAIIDSVANNNIASYQYVRHPFALVENGFVAVSETATTGEIIRFEFNSGTITQFNSASVTDDYGNQAIEGETFVKGYGNSLATGKYIFSTPRYKANIGGVEKFFGKVFIVNSSDLTGLTELPVTESNWSGLEPLGPNAIGGNIDINDSWIVSVNPSYRENTSVKFDGCIQIWSNDGNLYPEHGLIKMSDFYPNLDGNIQQNGHLHIDGNRLIVGVEPDVNDSTSLKFVIFDINNLSAPPQEVTSVTGDGVVGGARIGAFYNGHYFYDAYEYETVGWTIVNQVNNVDVFRGNETAYSEIYNANADYVAYYATSMSGVFKRT